MNKELNPFKIIGSVMAVLLAIVIIFNCYTIVNTNHEASVESFGEVKKGEILTGFNWVAPWWGIDEYSTEHEIMSYEDLGVASQDKFKTNMDVSFTGSFKYGYADKTRASSGDANRFLETHVYKRILSCLTKAGAEVPNSQAFFNKEIQVGLSNSTINCVNSYLDGVGGQYVISTVQFSDIRLDKRVQSFMVETKKRQEQENQATSDLHIAEINAQKVVKQSKAKLDAADNNKQSAILLAEGAKQANILEAEGISASLILEAEGNTKLNKSITDELTEYVKAKRWDGKLPTTMAGTGTEFLIDNRTK